MDRVLVRYPSLDDETFTILYWLLEPRLMEPCVRFAASRMEKKERASFLDDMERHLLDRYNFAENMEALVKKRRRDLEVPLARFIRRLLKIKIAELSYSGRSEMEVRLAELGKMFRLSRLDLEICFVLFVISQWYRAESFFEDHLRCTYYSGRNYLAVMLGVNTGEIADAVRGRLARIGILNNDESAYMCLESGVIRMFQDLASTDAGAGLFKRIVPEALPLSAHMVDEGQTDHALNLLTARAAGPTHILLYGPPGTGKTSYAHGLAQKLGYPVYEVRHGGRSNEWKGTAALSACVNMAAVGPDCIVLSDDSDTILNTAGRHSQGDYSDKKWLHDLLEEPGVRMIWIVNSIEHLDESVIRRFAFSVRFRPFSRGQRVRLWENILDKNDCGGLFGSSELEEMADRFQCSPGAIDQAAAKASIAEPKTKDSVRGSLTLALEAHELLLNRGSAPVRGHGKDPSFTLEGLNVVGADLPSMLDDMKSYDAALRSGNRDDLPGARILFHGPPGTGKSCLARNVAIRLDRDIVLKRASDLLSKWVGETEQNIRDAYVEAAAKEAILIFDEADSLILNRDRAMHSWETSLTNEFLNRMEEFTGIQIFTTNRLKDLDSAGIRRFLYKVEFRFLKPEGNVLFYRRMLAGLTREAMNPEIEKRLRSLSRLTPGDMKLVKDKFTFKDPEDVTHNAMVTALEEEVRIKTLHAGDKPMGFLA